jgi:ABC-type branched-subunit amino acid transport system ATPase component
VSTVDPTAAVDISRGAIAMTKSAQAEELVARGIRVYFQGLKAVDGVDLPLRRGEIVGLIGPNGAGKTTFVNALTGFQRLTGGEIALGGVDVTGWPPYRLAKLGLARTFQSLRFFRGLTVFENVEVAGVSVGLSRKEAKRRAWHFLELMGLHERAELKAESLPYGSERRLEIARAVATSPRFLLLDEPAAGLNEAESDELVQTIGRLRDELSCGVLVIEHDMSVIMRLCERIHVLNYGKTISVGTPDEIQHDEAVLTAYLGHKQEPDGGDAAG